MNGKISVYVSGAHSTGKTTLLKSLQKHQQFSKLGFKRHVEVSRLYIESNGITTKQLGDPTFLFKLEKKFVDLQYSAEENEIKESSGSFTRFLWDRSIIDPIAYTKAGVGDKEAEELINIPIVGKMLERLKEGEDCLVFIIKPHMATVEKDGVRKDPEFRELEKLHEAFIAILEQQRIPYTEITCLDLQKRTDIVVDAVKIKWQLV